MNDIGTIICLLLSSFSLIVFGFLSVFITEKLNSFVETKYKKSFKKKIKFLHFQKIKVKEELKLIKILGGVMFFFGAVFMCIFAFYMQYSVHSV